LPEQNPR